MKNFWNEKKAHWYRKALRHTDFPEKAIDVILSRVMGCSSVVDIGAGCGTLAIPLARVMKKVTALDPSHAMIRLLKDDANRYNLHNIEYIEGQWEDLDVEPHDIAISSNVVNLWRVEPAKMIKKIEKAAKKYVFIILAADPDKDKFYYKEIFPLLFQKEYQSRGDYLSLYNSLHSLGIFADITIIDYRFDQPFTDMEDALDFWREYIPLDSNRYDKKLREYLENKLIRRDGQYWAEFKNKGAIICWEKGCSG